MYSQDKATDFQVYILLRN